jgi:hypothetical protein
MLVTKKNELKTLSLQENRLALSNIRMGGSVTVLPDLLEFYLLLYAAFSW